MICEANSVPILSWASPVAAPMCGVKEIFGCIKMVSSGFGSLSKTSYPAKDTFPESNAFIKATSSITPPRAQFTIPTPSFIVANAASSTM